MRREARGGDPPSGPARTPGCGEQRPVGGVCALCTRCGRAARRDRRWALAVGCASPLGTRPRRGIRRQPGDDRERVPPSPRRGADRDPARRGLVGPSASVVASKVDAQAWPCAVRSALVAFRIHKGGPEMRRLAAVLVCGFASLVVVGTSGATTGAVSFSVLHSFSGPEGETPAAPLKLLRTEKETAP